MGGEADEPEELIQAGAVTSSLEYRTLHEGSEEGVCVHVYGDRLEGPCQAFLRLDCIRVASHHHYRNASVKKNERLPLDFTVEWDSLA